MMIKRRYGVLLGVLMGFQVHAFSCYLTMVKDSCWTDYTVSVNVIHDADKKVITNVQIPQGESWARQEFVCQPGEILSLQATFSPVFWAQDVGKVYSAQHNWQLPSEVKDGDTAWNLTVCYPESFSEVPFPPNAAGNCQCNTKIIPPVKPK